MDMPPSGIQDAGDMSIFIPLHVPAVRKVSTSKKILGSPMNVM
jgi:hypothetical protein